MMDRRTFLGSLVAALAGSEIVRAVEVPPVPAIEFRTCAKGQFPHQDIFAWRMPWFYRLEPGKLRVAQDFQLERLGCELPNVPADQIVELLDLTSPEHPNGPAVELFVNGRPLFASPVTMMGCGSGILGAAESLMPVWPALIIPAGTEIEFRCAEGIALYLCGSVEANCDVQDEPTFIDAEFFDDDEDKEDYSASDSPAQVASTTQPQKA